MKTHLPEPQDHRGRNPWSIALAVVPGSVVFYAAIKLGQFLGDGVAPAISAAFGVPN